MKWFHRLFDIGSRSTRRTRPTARRPEIEQLEDRLVPAPMSPLPDPGLPGIGVPAPVRDQIVSVDQLLSNGVPVLNSNPGAPVNLFLDFDGSLFRNVRFFTSGIAGEQQRFFNRVTIAP